MANLAEQLRNERRVSLKEKYSKYLGEICEEIRKKGLAEFECPNDCDVTADNMTEFLKNEGFTVKRILWKPWHPRSFTKCLEIRA